MSAIRGPGLSPRRRMTGLSLIELMIALVMSLIVAAGIISVFASTSSSNKVQAQLATLQEEGRFAIHSLRTDIGDANGTYCSNTGGNAGATASGLLLDALRTPTVFANDITTVNAVFRDNTTSLASASPTGAYALPSFLFMRGYGCGTTAGSCTPTGLTTLTPGIPAMGKLVGDRVLGASVLTLRYLQPGSGWTIVPAGVASGSTIGANATGTVTSITLNPRPDEPPVSDFTGTLAMLADCSTSQIFAVTNSSGTLTPTGANYAQPLDISQGSAPRVFDFANDFQTITYFLRVVCADGSNPCVHTTGELVRRVNGVDQPLVRGIERMDFRYAVIDAAGATRFLTPAEVDTGDSGAIACPPGISAGLVAGMPGSTPQTGCLWRAVQAIEVHILMDGQAPLYTLTPAETNYAYSFDGDTMPVPASAHSVKPNAGQGFPIPLLRREFTTLVSLRNYNP